jgi:hypothetical protein
MKQSLLMERYPVFDMTIAKTETTYASVDEILAALKEKIDAHPKVAYIATFDHYAHTQSIDGDIAGSIRDAKNIVFCFGMKLPNPHVLAVRPRSIGVADMQDHFHITFMEPPMEIATTAMESWCKDLLNA